ncbi:MAG TPA: polyphosphate polymerase domain-containing protein [Verrucomicrobiota bacterium]|nr:polyphosphate polymerase domain-containing protein [Verrucomicrobiota bacterium]HNT14522.1 polyphosphate polymerase domain-containing protein [Verrucomicrobiota bacterium]
MTAGFRYERKFLPSDLDLARALAVVHRHPSLFREVYPPRLVNNIYLDSPRLDNYHDHVNGTANRSKTRVRWYGHPRSLIENPALEQKIKRGTVSRKETHPLPSLRLEGETARSRLDETFRIASLPELLRSRLQHLQPSLFNCYRRHYFLSQDRRFRLTVDSDLRFEGIDGNTNVTGASASTALHPSGFVIIELKYSAENAGLADAVTNALPFRVTRCSKYILGIQCAVPA